MITRKRRISDELSVDMAVVGFLFDSFLFDFEVPFSFWLIISAGLGNPPVNQ